MQVDFFPANRQPSSSCRSWAVDEYTRCWLNTNLVANYFRYRHQRRPHVARRKRAPRSEKSPMWAFWRTRVEFINGPFAENEVDEIWITFLIAVQKPPGKKLPHLGRLFPSILRLAMKPAGGSILKLTETPTCLYQRGSSAATPFPKRFLNFHIYGSGMPTRCRSKRPTRNVFLEIFDHL